MIDKNGSMIIGDIMNKDVKEHKSVTRVALNLDTIDKYMPGKQLFYIQALTPTKEKTKDFLVVNDDLGNIINKDKKSLNCKMPKVGSAIELDVPKDVSRWFEVKFINPGERFLVSVDGPTPGKIIIMGRDYITEQGGYNGDERTGGGSNE